MLCNRLFDFVTGTEIVVPPASIRAPLWDIVRPNEAATDLLAAHAEVLRSGDRRPERLPLYVKSARRR